MRSPSIRRKLLALGLLLVLGSLCAFGQRLDGTLRGIVTDQTGAVVPDVKVTVTNQSTGVAVTTTTTSAGTWTFPNLLVGKYSVKLEKSGFKTQVRSNIDVISSAVTDANSRLEIGAGETVVEVAAGADIVNTTDSQLSNSIPGATVVALPLSANNGNLIDLAQLAPNTVPQGGGVLGQGGSVGGQRARFNNFNVDGADDNAVDVTGTLSTVIQDAVAEFNVITNQFSAEYGHSAGGQFNIVTKSGTNNWHGSAFERFNNRKLNAFDNIEKAACEPGQPCVKPRFDYNVAGGTIGGPIKKDKIFIFGAFQRQWAGYSGSSSIFETPTATGLSNLKTLAQDQAVLDILSAFPTATTATRTANVTNFGKNQTLPVEIGRMSALGPAFKNEWDWQANGDINLGPHQVRARFLFNQQRQPDLATPPIAYFNGFYKGDSKKAVLSDAWTINDHLINDLRLGYTRYINDYTVPSKYANFPQFFLHDLDSFQLGPETNAPQGGGQNVYQLLDQMSYSKGRHTFKWGGEFRRWIAMSRFLPRERGEWQYASMQQFINDYVPTALAKRGAGSAIADGNQMAIYGFVQDDIKVTPRFTLNLGLRYEWTSISNMERNQSMNEIANLPGTLFMFGVPKSDKKDFMPRVGFAWDPTGSAKWSVRGGFGVAYDVYPQNFALNSQPPQRQSEQDPDITCTIGGPAWCSGYNSAVWTSGGNTGQGFLQTGGLLQVNVPPTTQLAARNSTQAVLFDHRMPRVMTWTLSVQHEIAKNTSLELRYLGTRGSRLLAQIQANARSAFDNGATALPTWFSQSSVPTSFTAASPTLAQFQSYIYRPYAKDGFIGPVTTFPGVSSSIYHSGSADLIHRFSHGLYMRANYTWAHTIDDGTNELYSSLVNPRRPEDGNHITQDRGRSVLDIRHKVAVSWNYDFPKMAAGNAFARGVVNGWSLNGSYVIHSGQPVTPLSFVDANGNKDSAGDRAILNSKGTSNTGSATQAVCWYNNAVLYNCDNVPPTTVDPKTWNAAPYIVGYVATNPNAMYVQARPGTRTDVGRNTLTSPGRNNWNMSFAKDTHITEQKYIQFRVEMFNVFNHRQYSFSNPGGIALAGIDTSAITASAFADVTSTQFLDPKQLNGGGREMQLQLKFIF